MSLAIGLANLVLGTVYTCYGLMTVVDMKRGWKTHGFSHFGLAWIAMAFTCGPHHLDHGLHELVSGRSGGWLDLVAIAVGFPAGICWFLLRVEAMWGGRGDRFIAGTPLWLESLPTVMAGYTAALITATIWLNQPNTEFRLRIIPNLLLVVLYSAIAAVLLRNQVRNRPATGGWSLSGLSLSMVMYTCALMHAVFSVYANRGTYDLDWHGLVIDTIAVPAAAYFLWVTHALTSGSLRDWNKAPDVARHPDRDDAVDSEAEPVLVGV
jgi:hypothetical protein